MNDCDSDFRFAIWNLEFWNFSPRLHYNALHRITYFSPLKCTLRKTNFYVLSGSFLVFRFQVSRFLSFQGGMQNAVSFLSFRSSRATQLTFLKVAHGAPFPHRFARLLISSHSPYIERRIYHS